MKSRTSMLDINRTAVVRIIEAVQVEGRDFVMEPEAKEILRACGIATPRGRTCPTLEEALSAAHEMGYPVAVKVVSPQVLHKTEVGGVRVNIASDAALKEAYDAMMSSVRTHVPPEAIRGVLVERMAQGHEIIIGASRDPQFGPLVMFGLGGIFVEILKDVSYRLAPLDAWDAAEMIHEIKGYPLLAGARGGLPVDEQVLADTLVRISRLVDEFPLIKEIDLNPTFVDGDSVIVADAGMILG